MIKKLKKSGKKKLFDFEKGEGIRVGDWMEESDKNEGYQTEKSEILEAAPSPVIEESKEEEEEEEEAPVMKKEDLKESDIYESEQDSR